MDTAGPFGPDLPAGQRLQDHGVEPHEFNTYGARRGNQEVMMGGRSPKSASRTSCSTTLRGLHRPPPDRRGDHRLRGVGAVPRGRYPARRPRRGGARHGIEPGLGREGHRPARRQGDHRGELRAHLPRQPRGHGVLPLQFAAGGSRELLGLDGTERYHIRGLDDGLDVNEELTVVATRADGDTTEFAVTAQVSTPAGVRYIEHGGILHYVLRKLLAA